MDPWGAKQMGLFKIIVNLVHYQEREVGTSLEEGIKHCNKRGGSHQLSLDVPRPLCEKLQV